MNRVPTTLVTGALGVGKTTAVLAALRHRPPGERWAVLVNEFGSVGIDGALLSDSGGLEVREIAGGCICCTANVPLRVALVRLLREVKPDRLFVEPTGLAHPASIVDVVRSPGVRESVALRATITLVDPARFLRGGDDLLADQVLAADVLVGNFADRTDPAVLERFRAAARALDPGPLVVATASFAEIDPAWLDLEPAPAELRIWRAAGGPEAHELGFTWPPERQFTMDGVQRALQSLVRPGPLLPDGVLRLKGVFHTERGFLSVQASPDAMSFAPLGWRRDSRVALLTRAEVADPQAIRAAFEG
jgi:G3E family GTPase